MKLIVISSSVTFWPISQAEHFLLNYGTKLYGEFPMSILQIKGENFNSLT